MRAFILIWQNTHFWVLVSPRSHVVWLELDISFYYMWFLDYYTGFPNILFTDLYRHSMFMCTYALDTVLFRFIDTHVLTWFQIYYRSFDFTYSLGYFLTTLNLHVQIQELRPCWPSVVDQSAQRKCGLAVVCSEPLFSQPPWSAREILILLLVDIFQSFYIAYHAFALLGDLIFLKYYIMLCDYCVLVVLLLECILPLCSRNLILTCTDT